MTDRCFKPAPWHVVLGVAGLIALSAVRPGYGQEADPLAAMISGLKTDPRGPYAAIRWHCPDGSVIPADARCSSPGGIQHAALKPSVQRLAEEKGLYWGQILAGTPVSDFLDAGRYFSRLKQYQLERYLQRVDDGWILRRARYYRGAVQFEDESAWGMDFFKTVLADNRLLASQFFLLRQAALDIPHFADDSRWQFIRSRSASIADTLPEFMPLRIKLHGQPEPADMDRLQRFVADHPDLDAGLRSDIEELMQSLAEAYRSGGDDILAAVAPRLPRHSASLQQLNGILDKKVGPSGSAVDLRLDRWTRLSALLVQIRTDILQAASPGQRLALLDLSNAVEEILFLETTAWRPATVGELLHKIALIAQACAGAGYLESWEWQHVAASAAVPATAAETDLHGLIDIADTARRIAEWGTGMVRAHYGSLVKRYQAFEPLAGGFVDDRVRGSLLLPLGDAAARLHALTTAFGTSVSRVMDLPDASRVRGLNPGYALGTLTVLDHIGPQTVLDEKDIVVLPHAPPDLKPVAGIATVSEGNLVSHVQLLARNLGIPNAILAEADLQALRAYSGQTVFYAVSPGGAVVMKPAAAMTGEERSLVEKRPRSEQRISVPLDRIDLRRTEPVPLNELTAADSGRWCGPKAANLGQLKHDFPDHVVNGFAIPFGAFRQHMDQSMPGTQFSYWQLLQQTLATDQGEQAVLAGLGRLRQAIGRMAFLPEFTTTVRGHFRSQFDAAMDDLPVFVRSDTNMEDLKDFTGAGLNLTVFNVRGETAIFQAIRDVWASVYTERSYRWRQHFLTNAENVFPSILILPTVNVAKSGVMITTGLAGGDAGDITVAFSRGAGGAVEGQMAESYRLNAEGGVTLLSPAREPLYTLLPESGGTAREATSFERPLLDDRELGLLRRMAATIRERLPAQGPWDIEAGIREGRIWLFQVRPYVENKQAQANEYLNRLDPPPPENRGIPLARVLP